MDLMRKCGRVLVLLSVSVCASKLLGDIYEPRGQQICKRGTEKPCYKIAYFQDTRRKLNFEDASRACRSDGGDLLSIESKTEQTLIENFIHELKASDGDFWIGLRRDQGYEEINGDCPSQYYWLDGSRATFRNWHWDEPSCGFEVCVVMYHQPSAPPGQAGPYMFQWNDDNCETKNNFICKYTKGALPTPRIPQNPSVTDKDDGMRVVVSEPPDNVLNIAYIVLPTIPLLLLLIVATNVFCFKLFTKRMKQQTETPPKEPGYWAAGERCNSPSPDVYNVIRRQHESDLAGTRPDIKNTSFLGSSPDTPPGDYDNLAGRDTESGFVTLTSTESGFVTNDLYDTLQGRGSGRYYRDQGWMDELYGY
ncbi:layilin-like isoform X2 [Sinocyclocheilus anshuiensis]|uniref:layilin-like isoform X2 n=1 Tax=Sinocyclocheilus anshuiensis TaxID=1608454 RepID=UPI0007B8EB02|nr:PREDICTED: layilin-like isoform X2 [Sinocyclocheilus anshuiensis]